MKFQIAVLRAALVAALGLCLCAAGHAEAVISSRVVAV
jgi:hypothetical protein